jgi:hypothetical protein
VCERLAHIALAPELQFDFQGSDRITALNGSYLPRRRIVQRIRVLEIVTSHE